MPSVSAVTRRPLAVLYLGEGDACPLRCNEAEITGGVAAAQDSNRKQHPQETLRLKAKR